MGSAWHFLQKMKRKGKKGSDMWIKEADMFPFTYTKCIM